ncbi:MAG: hypothetical protein EXS51_03380 [Candidatus Taylorbacteria bacterium]|nr:hypothetical protein [Candidatus Taylorbacteria bacterium]
MPMTTQTISERYLREFVYGAIDGTVTTFAIVSGVVGANLSPSIVLVLGLANVLADGFSMASSNFLAERSEIALHHGVEALPAGTKAPLKTASVTFFSFITVGFIPLFPFALAFFVPAVLPYEFGLSIALTAVAFVGIGAVRGIVTKHRATQSALETLLVGGLAALISFAVGYFLRGLAGGV